MKFIPGDKVRVIKLPTEDDKVDYFECIQLGDEGRVLPFNFGYDSVGGRYFVNLPKRKCEFWLSEDNLELMPEQGSYTIDHLESQNIKM